MLLRTRVILIVSVCFVGLAAVLVHAGLRRERVADERYAEATIAGQKAVWHEVVTSELTPITQEATRLAEDGRITAALAHDDRNTLARLARAAFERLVELKLAARMEIHSKTGALIFTSNEAVFPQPTFNATLVDDVIRLRRPIRGVGHDPGFGFLAAVGMPARDEDGSVVGVIALARDLTLPLTELSDNIGTEAIIVNRRGRVLTGTRPELWERLVKNGNVSRIEPLQVARLDGRIYTTVSVPIDGFTGAGIANLVTIRDTTANHARQTEVSLISALAAGALLIIILAMLFHYLRRSFRPLDNAIASLNALSQGDTSVSLDSDQRNDEIGRISSTVEVFRANAMALERLKRSRDKQRRRQERLIRNRMSDLSLTLDDEARAAVLKDLEEIESAMARRGVNAGDADGLGYVAMAMEKLTDRVTSQQQSLRQLIEELREALKTRAAFAALQQDLAIAARIQQSVLPRAFPDHPRIKLCGRMITAKEVGGDFYDYFLIDEHRLAVVIADVSGKGVPAAFFMAIARTMLKATALLVPSPGDAMRQLNDLLATDNDQGMFVTLFYGILDLRDFSFVYVNAGHNPPVLIRPGGETSVLALTGGIALGVMDGMDFAEGQLTLSPDDTLFCFTDGITEAMNPEGEQFTDPRLIENLQSADRPAVDVVADDVIAAVKTFARGADQSDDITCVVLRVH